MSKASANCAVCGAQLVYHEAAQPVVCDMCGKEETGHSICERGHYVCDACHRSAGVELIMRTCAESTSSDPIAIAIALMRDNSIYPNGPEHHSLVGAVLLAAYRNAGGDVDLQASLAELRNRSLQIPGGTCGFWGCCGAAVSAGQFYSIVSGSTPLAKDAWGETARLTSRIIGRLADVGGPRCCKRTSFISILETADYVAETTGVKMDVPAHVTCSFMAGNAQCLRRTCPFFPQDVAKRQAD